MSAIFALANQKGGVAKTTTTGILAAGLKKQGFSVLTIDCDPQGNLSMSVAAENQDSATMYEVMKGTVSARDAIQHTPSCDIIPANTILAGIEQELHNVGKEMTLREKLRDEQTGVAEAYDYILIDCPPSLGLLTVNALTAADYLLIPTMAETFAASGITQLYDTYKSAHAHRAHPCHQDHSGADRKNRGLHGRGRLPNDHPQQRDHQGSAGCTGERV